jgi:hypothetical protein
MIWANGNVYCHRGCDFRAIKDELGVTYTPPDTVVENRRAARWSQRAEAIWVRSILIDRTPIETYLRGRGLPLPENGLRALQPDRKFDHWRMVAKITDAVTAEPLSLHFTHLHSHGRREKRYLSGHAKKGGVVRLFSHGGGLTIAEGIESGWQG